jgi:exopolysaccharide production protein ExoQ
MKSYSAWVLAVALFLIAPVAALAPLGEAPLLHITGLCGLLAYRAEHRRWPIPHTEPAKALGYFMLYVAASCLWARAGNLAWLKLVEITAMALSAVIIPVIIRDLPANTLPLLRKAFLYGLALGLLLFFGDILLGMPIQKLHLRGPAPLLVFYDRGAIVLGLLLWPAALIMFITGRGWLALAALLAYTIAIFCLESHSEMVGMVLGLFVLAVGWFWPKVARRGLSTLWGAGFVLAIPIAFLLQRYAYLIMPYLQFSFRDRIGIWSFTAERILHWPYFGLGLMGARAIPVNDLPLDFLPLDSNKPPLHPHNFFLQIWLELGLAGVCLCYFLLANIISYTKFLPRYSMRLALAAIAACLPIASFAFGVWQGWWIATTIFLLATILVVSRLEPVPGRDAADYP